MQRRESATSRLADHWAKPNREKAHTETAARLLRHHYERLPEKLAREVFDPHIPWLYNFKIDFRFK